MGSKLYDLVFTGDIASNLSRDTVAERLSTTFGLDRNAADRLVRGSHIIIKKGLDHKMAARYLLAFEQNGMICTLEEASASCGEAVATEGEGHGESKGERVYLCPSCGNEQHESYECGRCGIIFDRYIKSTGSESKAAAANASITFYDLAKERRQIVLLIALLAILATTIYWRWSTSEITHPPGILAPYEPVQVILKGGKPWQVADKLIFPLAQFRLRARVLGKERYRFDTGSELSPFDLALGWGPMSDQSVLDQLVIGQGNRRFALIPAGNVPPLPWPVIMYNSSNMHIIPASEDVRETLSALRKGEVIELSGYLVGIQVGGEWTWVSSLQRNDTGDGACEIVWVEKLGAIPVE